MPQFGLLALPIFIILNLPSGGTTPMESMPATLQRIMQFSPSPTLSASPRLCFIVEWGSMWSGRTAL